LPCVACRDDATTPHSARFMRVSCGWHTAAGPAAVGFQQARGSGDGNDVPSMLPSSRLSHGDLIVLARAERWRSRELGASSCCSRPVRDSRVRCKVPLDRLKLPQFMRSRFLSRLRAGGPDHISRQLLSPPAVNPASTSTRVREQVIHRSTGKLCLGRRRRGRRHAHHGATP
jgi:hypothetical protein